MAELYNILVLGRWKKYLFCQSLCNVFTGRFLGAGVLFIAVYISFSFASKIILNVDFELMRCPNRLYHLEQGMLGSEIMSVVLKSRR